MHLANILPLLKFEEEDQHFILLSPHICFIMSRKLLIDDILKKKMFRINIDLKSNAKLSFTLYLHKIKTQKLDVSPDIINTLYGGLVVVMRWFFFPDDNTYQNPTRVVLGWWLGCGNKRFFTFLKISSRVCFCLLSFSFLAT